MVNLPEALLEQQREQQAQVGAEERQGQAELQWMKDQAKRLQDQAELQWAKDQAKRRQVRETSDS